MLPHGLLDIEQHALTRNTPKRTPLRAAGSPQAVRRAAPSSPTPRAPPVGPCPARPRRAARTGAHHHHVKLRRQVVRHLGSGALTCPPRREAEAAARGGFRLRRAGAAGSCSPAGPRDAGCVCVWQPAPGEPCHLTATLGVGLHSETFPFSSAHFNSFPNKNVNFFLSLRGIRCRFPSSFPLWGKEGEVGAKDTGVFCDTE